MNRLELKKMIREIVQEEIYNSLPELIHEALSEVIASNRPARKMVKESVYPKEQTESYPIKRFDTTRLKEMMGYGDGPTGRYDEGVSPEDIPNLGGNGKVPTHVVKAITRDYSSLMKAIDARGKK